MLCRNLTRNKAAELIESEKFPVARGPVRKMNVHVNTRGREGRVGWQNRQTEWIRRRNGGGGTGRSEDRSRRERWLAKEDRKDGARDLDLYSAIVVPSSTEQPLTPLTSNSCLLIPVAHNPPFHPWKPWTVVWYREGTAPRPDILQLL